MGWVMSNCNKEDSPGPVFAILTGVSSTIALGTLAIGLGFLNKAVVFLSGQAFGLTGLANVANDLEYLIDIR